MSSSITSGESEPVAPVAESSPSTPPSLVSKGPLTLADVSGEASDHGSGGVDVAYRWAQLYKNDVEYERFFDWIGRRSNPERTDFKQILDSIPIEWAPEDLPPPLRRYFLQRFG